MGNSGKNRYSDLRIKRYPNGQTTPAARKPVVFPRDTVGWDKIHYLWRYK